MPSNSALSILRAHYAQAAELLLLRRLDEAEVACERALGQLGPMIREVKKTTRSEDSRRNVDWPRKVWLLRIALTSAQLEEQPISTVNDEQLLLINERVRNSYADNEDIHPDIIAALEMLALKFNCLDAARIIAETWLASLTDVIFEAVTRANTLITDPSQSGTLTDRELSGSTVLLSHPSTTNDADSSNTTANVEEQLRKGYERVIELYTLHVLPQLDEWETAHEFLTYNDMLHTTKQKICLKSLKRLRKAAIKAQNSLIEQQQQQDIEQDTSWMESTWISTTSGRAAENGQALTSNATLSSTSPSPSPSSSSPSTSSPLSSSLVNGSNSSHGNIQHQGKDVVTSGSTSTGPSKSTRHTSTTSSPSSPSPSSPSSFSWLVRLEQQCRLLFRRAESYGINYWIITLTILWILRRLLSSQPTINRLLSQGWQKFLQTIKMGTTVTYV